MVPPAGPVAPTMHGELPVAPHICAAGALHAYAVCAGDDSLLNRRMKRYRSPAFAGTTESFEPVVLARLNGYMRAYWVVETSDEVARYFALYCGSRRPNAASAVTITAASCLDGRNQSA